MSCFDCGNCRQGEAMYYCPAQNEFVIGKKNDVIERQKTDQGWKKGSPDYEKRRRRIRQNDIEKIG